MNWYTYSHVPNRANGSGGKATAAQIPAALSSATSVNGTSIPASVTLTQTICSGTISIPATAIASAFKSAFTATCTGGAATDNAMVNFAGGTDPTTLRLSSEHLGNADHL